jgi:predicted enzyme related to lactoylglutathione lyase
MAKVIGIGGTFLRAADPERLYAWYEANLGLTRGQHGCVDLHWPGGGREEATSGKTVWALFPHDTTYFGPANPAFMLNYVVDDLDGMLEALRAAGADVDPRTEDHDYGRFAWVTDPEGNRIELWEPPAKK